MRFRSSNAGLLVVLIALLIPIVALGYAEVSHRTTIALIASGACVVALACIYVDTCELNKTTGQFLMRRWRLLSAKSVSFPLRDIVRVKIKARDFGGGYRTGNPIAFQLAVVRSSGEEIKLTGWRSSTEIQKRGFAIADFLAVPFDTLS
jgi:hypothetical protein